MTDATARPRSNSRELTLFLCGDVMTGRGIDQILPHPSPPHLFEPSMRSALGYVRLAERKVGHIPRPVDYAYIWGDALAEFARVRPDLRIVNLETSVTTSEDAEPGKGINYRMNPANAPCLTAAGIDCCVPANNHVLDWGPNGLTETLNALHRSGIATAGAGGDASGAAAPAVLRVSGKARLLVFAYGMESGGVPPGWAAGPGRPGVNFLADLSRQSIEAVGRRIRAEKEAGDVVVVSLHWGANWGYAVSPAQRDFAHRLIDAAGVDLVHGHSSHHVKGIEVYRDRLILYGCGDFLNDYEGIEGYEEYRGDLALMYFPTLDAATGRLLRLVMIPTQIRRLRVNRAPPDGAHWLMETLNREGERFGTGVKLQADGSFLLVRS